MGFYRGSHYYPVRYKKLKDLAVLFTHFQEANVSQLEHNSRSHDKERKLMNLELFVRIR